MKFELGDIQLTRLNAWAESHLKEHKFLIEREVTGVSLKYTFIPSGLGDDVEVECLWCVKRINLTIGDQGEFLFNEDGTENW